MSFDELLAQAQSLSMDQKLKLVHTLTRDIEHEITLVLPVDAEVQWLTPVLGEGSLQALYELLQNAHDAG